MEKHKRYTNAGYNKRLKPLARALRGNMTKAEACLWKYALQGRRLKGYQFRRQRPVLDYIADFMCIRLNLIIEVDGLSHDNEEVQQMDEVREIQLKRAGFHVVRFSDEDVLTDVNGVISAIEQVIDSIENLPLPPPAPLQGGGQIIYPE